MNIKVCGVNSFKQLQQLDGLNVDFAGLIFVNKDPSTAGSCEEALSFTS